jgi:argininosuccinate synthase
LPTTTNPRIVLAYSGSFEASLAIRWLREQRAADVVTLTLDFGQGRELEAVQDRALATGAARAHVLDVRDEFAREYVLASLKADAVGDTGLVLARALARPLIARKLVEIAAIERAGAVAHGATTAEGGPAPLDRLIADVDPTAHIIATRREWAADRQGQLAFAAAHGLAAGPAPDRHTRVETTLWGRWIDTNGAPADATFTLTRAVADCPAEPATVDILFERGVPRAINGVAMPLVELIASLGTIAGAHGVGRTQSPGAACEAPAAVLLHDAHRQLEARVLPEDLRRFAQIASREYVDLIRGGGWFTPLREALDAFFEQIQQRANGAVRLKLFKGQVTHE